MGRYFKQIILAIFLLFILCGFEAEAIASSAEMGKPRAKDNEVSSLSSSQKQYSGEKISLDFQNVELSNIVRIIGEVAGKEVNIPPEISGKKLTLKLQNVPWDQALDIALKSQGFGFEQTTKVLTIYNLSEPQKVLVQEKTKIKKHDELAPLRKQVFSVKYSPAEQVSEALNKLKTKRGKIVLIGNDIYVEDEPKVLSEMAQAFMRIDRVAGQILIETRIVESSPAFAEKYSFKRLEVQLDPEEALPPLNVLESLASRPESEFSASSPHGFKEEGSGEEIRIKLENLKKLPKSLENTILKLSILDREESKKLKAVFNSMEKSNDIRILTAPRSVSGNGQKISIKQRANLPCQPSSRSSRVSCALKDSFIMLELTPHIELGNKSLSIDIELINTEVKTGVGSTSKKARKKLTVQDGESIVIGGVFNDKSSSEEGSFTENILLLSDWAANMRPEGNGPHPELLIFITANIIPINI